MRSATTGSAVEDAVAVSSVWYCTSACTTEGYVSPRLAVPRCCLTPCDRDDSRGLTRSHAVAHRRGGLVCGWSLLLVNRAGSSLPPSRASHSSAVRRAAAAAAALVPREYHRGWLAIAAARVPATCLAAAAGMTAAARFAVASPPGAAAEPRQRAEPAPGGDRDSRNPSVHPATVPRASRPLPFSRRSYSCRRAGREGVPASKGFRRGRTSFRRAQMVQA